MKLRWFHFYSLLFPLQITGLLFYLILNQVFPCPGSLEWFLITGLSSLLSQIVLLKCYSPDKNSLLKQLRILLLYLIFLYLYYQLFRVDFLKPDFRRFPPELIILLVGSLLSWLITDAVAHPFLHRENFHAMLFRRGKGRIKEKIRNLGYYLKQTLDQQETLLKQCQRSLWISSLILGVLLLMGKKIGIQIGAFLLIHLTLSLYWRLKLSQNIEEDGFLGEGIALKGEARRGEGKYYLLLLALIIPVSWIISGPKALLPYQWLEKIMHALSQRFQSRQVTREKALEEVSQRIQRMPVPESPAPSIESQPSSLESFEMPPVVKKILFILSLIIISSALVYYLIFPLLKKKAPRIQHREPWYKRLKAWFTEILQQWKDNKKKYEELGVEWVSQNSDGEIQIGRRKDLQEEKRLRKGMIGAFLSLCRWGAKKGIPYNKGTGPEAYCKELAEEFPELRQDFLEKGKLFRKEFYSQIPSDKIKVQELQNWVTALKKRRRKI